MAQGQLNYDTLENNTPEILYIAKRKPFCSLVLEYSVKYIKSFRDILLF